MKNKINIGDKINGIVILRNINEYEKKILCKDRYRKYYLCECCCHNFYFIAEDYILRGNTSCGCLRNNYPRGLINGVVKYSDVY